MNPVSQRVGDSVGIEAESLWLSRVQLPIFEKVFVLTMGRPIVHYSYMHKKH